MTFLPIVERELRVASRKSATYWSRSAIALMAILVASWQFTIYMRFPTRLMGQSLFWVIGGIAMLHSLLCGIRATADSLKVAR